MLIGLPVFQDGLHWLPIVFKINSDCTRREEDGMASCGGLIPGSTGAWILGFAKSIGNISFQHAHRKGNKVVDQIAKLVLLDTVEVKLFTIPPHVVGRLLHADIRD
ncbi:hypothetical protein V6N12_053766 [Hibiscus sabdariffa]|uniref:RNase H type-1 domain-containing protein n=1 Tax=Hibiscus sabdariffa TaxID=183260 RepID=A0ABR2D8M0_9ROSI